MTGIKDPTEPKKEETQMERPADVPVLVSLTSILKEPEVAFKGLQESVTAILDNAKNHMTEKIDYVGPFAENLSNTVVATATAAAAAFETQLKAVNTDFFNDCFRSMLEKLCEIQTWVKRLMIQGESSDATTANSSSEQAKNESSAKNKS